MREKNKPIVKLKYDCNVKFLLGRLYTPVWQYIYKRDFIDGIKFIEIAGEDHQFMIDIFKKHHVDTLKVPYFSGDYYYYYQYFRFDSIMSNLNKIYSNHEEKSLT